MPTLLCKATLIMKAERRFLVKAYPRHLSADAYTLCDILSETGLDVWVNELSEEETDGSENPIHVTVPEAQAEQAGQALHAIMAGADDLTAARVHAEISTDTGRNLRKFGITVASWGAVMLVLLFSFAVDAGLAFTLGGVPLLVGLAMWLVGSRRLASAGSA